MTVKRLLLPIGLGLCLALIVVLTARWQCGTIGTAHAGAPPASLASTPAASQAPARPSPFDDASSRPEVYSSEDLGLEPAVHLPLVLKSWYAALDPLPPPIPLTGTPPIDFPALRTALLADGTDLAFVKIGFHVGPTKLDLSQLCDALESLDAAGVPFFMKTVDTTGSCFYEAHRIALTSTVPHTVVYRKSGDGWDVPDYWLPPDDAAAAHWSKHRDAFPKELDASVVWMETINEVAREFVFDSESQLDGSGLVSPFREKFERYNVADEKWEWVLTNAEWLGRFALESANLVLAEEETYRWAAFGWSSGEPEAEDWEGPLMREFLEVAAEHPDRIAIALHEYSYEVNDVANAYHYLVGRFQALFQVCDAHNIPRPIVLITEWGWTYSDVPGVSDAMQDIAWASWLYAAYPQVKGAAMWYLGGGDNWGDIGQQTALLIEPMEEYALSHYFVIEQGQGAIAPEIFQP